MDNIKHIFKETDLPILQVKLTDFKQQNKVTKNKKKSWTI